MGSARAFDALMGSLDYPMLIVTATDGGRPAGCLIGFATQTSIDPPRFMACLSQRNRTYRVARRTGHLAVHVVPEDAGALAELFGGETSDEADKFSRCAWDTGPHGLPILRECPRWFVGRVRERVGLGDHVGFLLEPESVHDGADDAALGFQEAKDIEAGHEA